jgi:hypothetical protein
MSPVGSQVAAKTLELAELERRIAVLQNELELLTRRRDAALPPWKKIVLAMQDGASFSRQDVQRLLDISLASATTTVSNLRSIAAHLTRAEILAATSRQELIDIAAERSKANVRIQAPIVTSWH